MLDYNFQCNDNINLEPRLQEYIKKKREYKKNNINPGFPLEKEFNITTDDINRIQAFSNGSKDIYDYKKQEKYIEEMPEPSFIDDVDERYKADPRFKRYLKKVKKDKEAIKQRNCYDQLSYEYEQAYKPLNHDFKPPSRNMNELMDSRDFELTSSYKYDNKPSKLSYKSRVYPMSTNKLNQLPPFDHDPQVNKIIGELDSYKHNLNKSYQRASEMDTDMKIVTPTINCNNKRTINSAIYRPVPYMGMNNNQRNIDIENDILNIHSSRGAKSYGYKNPVEHFYDYISNDIQDPSHVVMNRPVSTRLDNQTTNKQYKREII